MRSIEGRRLVDDPRCSPTISPKARASSEELVAATKALLLKMLVQYLDLCYDSLVHHDWNTDLQHIQ